MIYFELTINIAKSSQTKTLIEYRLNTITNLESCFHFKILNKFYLKKILIKKGILQNYFDVNYENLGCYNFLSLKAFFYLYS